MNKRVADRRQKQNYFDLDEGFRSQKHFIRTLCSCGDGRSVVEVCFQRAGTQHTVYMIANSLLFLSQHTRLLRYLSQWLVGVLLILSFFEVSWLLIR